MVKHQCPRTRLVANHKLITLGGGYGNITKHAWESEGEQASAYYFKTPNLPERPGYLPMSQNYLRHDGRFEGWYC